MEKIFVQVKSKKTDNGEVIPLSLSWTDGRTWKIDRVIHSCSSLSGDFEGIRYTVIIGNEERYIYRTGHDWYVTA